MTLETNNISEQAFLNMALLTEHEQRKVAEAIARVERDTDAELVTVLAARADDYAYIPLLWASLLALVVPGVVHYLTGLADHAQPAAGAMEHLHRAVPGVPDSESHHAPDPALGASLARLEPGAPAVPGAKPAPHAWAAPAC